MTLPFSLQIGGKPTEFVQKIWLGLIIHTPKDENEGPFIKECAEKDLLDYPLDAYQPKLHTIREDKLDRWKPGNNIHFVVNNRSKDRFQFAPVKKVVSIQRIEIDNIFGDKWEVKVDDKILTENEIETLAINDGFDSVVDFWNFFKYHDFKGKIIHWTDLRY